MDTLIGHSITYRIAAGPRQGRKVLTLQSLPAIDEPFTTRAGNPMIGIRTMLAQISPSRFPPPGKRHLALAT